MNEVVDFNVQGRDAAPMTAAQLGVARVVPRVKTLRTTLGPTQDEFAVRTVIR